MDRNARRLVLLLGVLTIVVGVQQAVTDGLTDALAPLVIGASLVVVVLGMRQDSTRDGDGPGGR